MTGRGSEVAELLEPPEDHVGPELDLVQVLDADALVNAAPASDLCVIDVTTTDVRSTLRVLKTLQPQRSAPAILLVAHSGSDLLALGRDEALASQTVVVDPEAGLPVGRKLLWLAMRRALESHGRLEEATYWQRRYSNLWDRAIPGLYRIAADGTVLSCNDTLVRMLGYDSKASLIGQPLFEVDAELAVDPRPLDRGSSPRPYWRRDTCLIRADGARLWCRMSDFPVPAEDSDPQTQQVFEGTVIGADWEFELSEQVRRNEALYLALFAAMSEGVVLMDEDGVVRACNHAAEELLGLPLREIQGRPIDHCVRRLHLPGGAAVPIERLWRCDQEMLRLSLANDRSCWAMVRTAPVLVPGDSDAVQYLVALADRSDQARSEKRCEEAELASRLAAGLSHDLRNYLTAICGTAGMLRLRGSAGDLDDVVTDAASQIERAGRNGAELLDRALQTVRELGESKGADTGSTFLDDQIGSIELLLRGLMHRSASLDVYLGAPGARISGSGVAIEQIVLNLVLNARQAIGDSGSIQVSTSLRAGQRGEPGVLLQVTDDGPGLSPEQAQHVFDPFYSGRQGGTGLGLVMVRELVQDLGGEISVHGDLGEGASFRVWLPRTV